jgi:hypothetical protein
MSSTVPQELSGELSMLAEAADKLDRALHTFHRHVDHMHGAHVDGAQHVGSLAERTITAIREECHELKCQLLGTDPDEDDLDIAENLANRGALA